MKKALLFLNGTYPDSYHDFYRREIKNKDANSLVVAVDGGLNFLMQIDIKPDLVVGDFDSIAPETKEKLLAPSPLVEKDQDYTDSELAIRLVLSEGYRQMVLYGGVDTRYETDHLLANIFLLSLAQELADKQKPTPFSIKMRDPGQEIYFVKNSTLVIRGKVGETVSIIPSDRTVTISYSGFLYPMSKNKKITTGLGQSLTLRNKMQQQMAKVQIYGRAIVIYHLANKI